MRSARLMIGVGVLVFVGGLLFYRNVLIGWINGQQHAVPWAFPISLLGVAGSLAILYLAIRMYRFPNLTSAVKILALIIGVLGVALWGTWSWTALMFARIPK